MQAVGGSVDGLEINDLRLKLRVPEHVPVIRCNAADKESVKVVLMVLLKRALNE
jgi:hypothetical protein